MGILNIIKEALEDATSLQVATLYGTGIVVNSGIDGTAKADLEKRIVEQTAAVSTARTNWLAATDMTDRWKLHRELRAAKSKLAELQEELSGVSPRDIFSKIQLAIGGSKTAGYSQIQGSGDGTHYLDQSLVGETSFLLEAHQANVKAAQESRQKLLDMALGLLKSGEEI